MQLIVKLRGDLTMLKNVLSCKTFFILFFRGSSLKKLSMKFEMDSSERSWISIIRLKLARNELSTALGLEVITIE